MSVIELDFKVVHTPAIKHKHLALVLKKHTLN
jgi:hypothetical protein